MLTTTTPHHNQDKTDETHTTKKNREKDKETE
jgi:hypothetical protein